MAKIYQSEYINKLVKNLRLSTSTDSIPSEVAGKIVPTFSINYPFNLKSESVTVTNSTSGIIFTTRTDADTFLTNIQLSLIKDATSTSTLTTVQCTPYEQPPKAILRIPSITLTAQIANLTQEFHIPIKLQRGSTVNVTNGTNVANILAGATAQFFEVPD